VTIAVDQWDNVITNDQNQINGLQFMVSDGKHQSEPVDFPIDLCITYDAGALDDNNEVIVGEEDNTQYRFITGKGEDVIKTGQGPNFIDPADETQSGFYLYTWDADTGVLAAWINYMVAMAMIISAVMKAMISFSGGEVQTG